MTEEKSKYYFPWSNDPEEDRRRKINAVMKELTDITGISNELMGMDIDNLKETETCKASHVLLSEKGETEQ